MLFRNGGIILEMLQLKNNAESLQKFLTGKADNVKLDRWSLELHRRNITGEHFPGTKNNAVDCLSRLPFFTEKINDNQLNNDFSIESTTEVTHTSISLP